MSEEQSKEDVSVEDIIISETAVSSEDRPESEKKLSIAQWAEIRALYELGQYTATQLAKKYGVNVFVINRHFLKNGIVRGSRSHEIEQIVSEKVAGKIAENAVAFESKRQEYLEETKKQAYEANKLIHKLTVSKIAEAVTNKQNLGNLVDTFKSLKLASDIIAKTREERFILLDSDKSFDAEVLPKLEFVDLTETELANIDQLGSNNDINADELVAELTSTDEDIIAEGLDGE